MKNFNYPSSIIKKEFEEFLCGENIFSRDNSKGHITGSCWILNRKKTKVLLTLHKKLNKWIPTGGHCEGEKNPFLIALREGAEETDLELIPYSKDPFFLDIHTIPQYKNVKTHKHYDYTYIFYPKFNENYKISDESIDLKWVSLNEISIFTKEKI